MSAPVEIITLCILVYKEFIKMGRNGKLWAVHDAKLQIAWVPAINLLTQRATHVVWPTIMNDAMVELIPFGPVPCRETSYIVN